MGSGAGSDYRRTGTSTLPKGTGLPARARRSLAGSHLFSSRPSAEVEIHFDIEANFDRFAILHSRFEFPLRQRIDCAFVEAHSQTTNDLRDGQTAIFQNDGLHHDRSLKLCVVSGVGILRFDTAD